MSDTIDKRTFKIAQLESLLQGFKTYKVDPVGITLDYIGETGESLKKVFDKNTDIYETIFSGANDEEALFFLKSIVDGNETVRKGLIESCKLTYTRVREMLEGLKKISPVIVPGQPDKIRPKNEIVGYSTDCVIWQISDIHFGDCNKQINSPSELAALLAAPAIKFPDYKPDVIIVSGDVSCRAGEEEFKFFNEFCFELSKHLWDECKRQRILVVPGNHDTSWLEDGTADKLAKFRESVTDKCYISPFGATRETFEDDKIIVSRSAGNERIPPFALVQYEQFNFEILLLVSSYYSGTIPEEIIDILKSAAPMNDKLKKLLRVDEGAFSQEYILDLTKELTETRHTRVAVTHHNVIQYGSALCKNRLSNSLLRTLYEKNIRAIFHGHIHLMEDLNSLRPPIKYQPYAIPCSTLNSEPDAGGSRGFCIHLLGHNDADIFLSTLEWKMHMDLAFYPTNLIPHYRICLSKDPILVEELPLIS